MDFQISLTPITGRIKQAGELYSLIQGPENSTFLGSKNLSSETKVKGKENKRKIKQKEGAKRNMISRKKKKSKKSQRLW